MFHNLIEYNVLYKETMFNILCYARLVKFIVVNDTAHCQLLISNNIILLYFYSLVIFSHNLKIRYVYTPDHSR